jgi:uncharacterized protein YegL
MAKTIHVVSILDRSGSMAGSQVEVVGAYNAFIETQRTISKEKGVAIKTTLVLFDDKYEEVYSKVPVDQTPELNKDVYYTRGMTALHDAIGKTISKFDNKKNVIFFIETDGFENASKEYTGTSVRALVEKKKTDGWDFNFVGADLDHATTNKMSNALGIDSSKTMAFSKSAAGYATRNVSFASATTSYIDTKNKSTT